VRLVFKSQASTKYVILNANFKLIAYSGRCYYLLQPTSYLSFNFLKPGQIPFDKSWSISQFPFDMGNMVVIKFLDPFTKMSKSSLYFTFAIWTALCPQSVMLLRILKAFNPTKLPTCQKLIKCSSD